MKKVASFIIAVLISVLGFAQNLVPNSSFEDTVACPNSISQIDRATGWSSYRQSPDYFNSCAYITYPNASEPSNIWGYQYSRTGNAYAGFIAYQKQVNNL